MPRQEQDAVSWYLCLIRANPLGTDEEPGKLPDTLKVHHSLIALQNPWQTYLNLWQAVRSRRMESTAEQSSNCLGPGLPAARLG
jgi:hypothetical protein